MHSYTQQHVKRNTETVKDLSLVLREPLPPPPPPPKKNQEMITYAPPPYQDCDPVRE